MTIENNQDKTINTSTHKPDESEMKQRDNAMQYDMASFSKLILSDLSKNRSGRNLLKKYKQSDVRDIIESYTKEQSQKKLVEISQLLYAKSPQYQRLIKHFSDMALFSYVVTPIRNIQKGSQSMVLKQYTEVSELLHLMNLQHEMKKLMRVAFKEDAFYGYIHRDKKSFYIQKIDHSLCKITSVEDGVFNFSIDMTYFNGKEDILKQWSQEVQQKYVQWVAMKNKNSRIGQWVELDPQNTICIKVNEEMMETFPPFSGSFDSVFDIEAFKRLRKDKEELGNYMILTQELPIRKDSEDNNDFVIDKEMMMFFHNMASDTVPENVGVITSPMKIEPIKFDKDRVDNDGVAKAERDFWASNGTSQTLFSSDGTSQGTLLSIKTDEELVFSVLTQITRWINRYLKFEFNDLMFNADILHVTSFNRQEMYKMYQEVGSYGLPVKNHLSATVGLQPIETMNMAHLENDILKLHDKFIPLQNSHTQSGDELSNKSETGGAPKKDAQDIGDEGSKSRDKK